MRMVRRWDAILLLVVSVGITSCTRCRTGSYNVLLITLDTTRADRLGCYGYRAAHTPALDKLASEGLLFTDALCHAPLTLPSHASMLTGLYPPEHGLRDNGRGRLPKKVTTLAEMFRRHRYRTAAFVASFVLDRQFGLDRGFEVYDDRMKASSGATEDPFACEVAADVVCERALDWLTRHAGERFFCWVHFFDPHTPYNPPEPYRSTLIDPYDGEIAFVDSQVGRIMGFLDHHGLSERTLVIVCGDHGEAFGEHGESGHGFLLHQETMRVPLIIRLPKLVNPAVCRDMARLVDIPATVADILGWPEVNSVVREHSTARLGQPRSLLRPAASDPISYGESLHGYTSHRWAPLYSVTTPAWKYIEAPEPELYHRLADAGEVTNLVSVAIGAASPLATRVGLQQQELRRTLQAMRGEMRLPHPDTVSASHDTILRLRSLGYTAGPPVSEPPFAAAHELKNPKTMVSSVLPRMEETKRLTEEGRWQEAAERLESLATASPESLEIREMLVRCYLELGQLRDARLHAEKFLTTEPVHRPMLIQLADILLKSGELDAAAATYRRALGLPPDPCEPRFATGHSKLEIKARINWGTALRHLGRLEEAAEQYQRVLSIRPESVEAHNNLANIYLLQNRRKLAVLHYSRALEHDPTAINSRLYLGQLLHQMGRYGEALRVWREGLKFHPNEQFLLYQLAWRLATCPDDRFRNGPEALELAKRLLAVTGNKAQVLDALAAAQAETGDFSNAVRTAEIAIRLLKTDENQPGPATEIARRLDLYRQSKPFRER
ncbi:MAG: sulfatase-like hydrolase/transferase [Kiritimatiellae bacterium]|nr:sulfatase-like hydrolase/transferase [Kiritimatiellia bacterium]